MVVLNLTSTLGGGSGTCTMQFHNSLIKNGIDSYTVVYGRYYLGPSGESVPIRSTRGKLMPRIRRKIFRWMIRKASIDAFYSCYNLSERYNCFSAKDILSSLPQKPDVVVIHWSSDFVNAKMVSDISRITGAKICYLMLDDAFLTGGCHYPFTCTQYQVGCANCPASDSHIVKWAVKKNLQHKIKHQPDSVCIACSSWDYNRARLSRIFRDSIIVKHLLYVDETLYKPDVVDFDSLPWNIPKNKKVVLFGASSLDEPRKGMRVLIDALQLIRRDDVAFLVVGKCDMDGLPSCAILAGYLDRDQLIKAYQVATVFVCPSYEDSGPIMINQSIMTGTPVVSYNIGVAQDLVIPSRTGYLAKSFDSSDLATGINSILDLTDDQYRSMSNNCRELGLSLFSTIKEDSWIKRFFLN